MLLAKLLAPLLMSVLGAVALLQARPATAQTCDPGWVPGPMTTALPGADGPIYAMIEYGSPPRLIVAGKFTHVGGIAANNIAAWDGVNWQSLGAGADGPVYALTVYNNLLIAGGMFLSPGTRVAAWNGSTWAAMGEIGPPTTTPGAQIFAMAVFDGYLHVGGRFDTVNGVGVNENAARYFNGTWSVGAGNATEVRAMAVKDWDGAGPQSPLLYIGGWGIKPLCYTQDGVTSTQIDGPAGKVYALTSWTGLLPPNGLVVGGDFDNWDLGNDNFITVNNIARLYGPGNQVLAIGGGLTGSSQARVLSLCTYGEDLMVGGNFDYVSGAFPAYGIARLDESENAWTTVAGGFTSAGPGTEPSVNAMRVFNNFLYAGGKFDSADNDPGIIGAQNIARWNNVTWGSVGQKPRVRAAAALGSRLFVGGEFGHVVQETPTSPALNRLNILTWNGRQTGSLGAGANGAVRAMIAYTTGSGPSAASVVIAGGDFTTVYGDGLNPSAPIGANRVAQWTEPMAMLPMWSAMGQGFNGAVRALERFNGWIVAGGSFTASGGTTTNRIAKYVGSPPSWQPLTSPDPGLNGNVFALKAFSDSFGGTSNYLVMGGDFTSAAATGVAANRILLRRESSVVGESAYQALGQGFNGPVFAIERYGSGLNTYIYAAGTFTQSGSVVVNRIARLNGANWEAVGSSDGFNNAVYALKSIGGYLYAAGAFTSVGLIPANRIARWNGSVWSAVDIGADDEANAIAAFQNEVVMGGFFTSVDSPAQVSPALARFSATGLPWIAAQPVADSAACGATADFGVTPAPGYTITYQWRRGSVPLADGITPHGSTISGATSGALSIVNAQPLDAGSYDCVMTSPCGNVTSIAVALTITGTCAPLCPADIAPVPSGDGLVNVQDLLAVIGAWGACSNPNDCRADIAPIGPPIGDDLVNVQDLLAVIGAWGACP